MMTSLTGPACGHWLALLASLLATGCFPAVRPGSFSDLQQKLDQAKLENTQLQQTIDDQRASLEQQQQLIANLQNIGGGQMDRFNVVDRIEFASLTGGENYDGRPGDDGITVYLRPLDREGDVLKVYGEISVKLVDNFGTETPRLLGVWKLDRMEDIRSAWHSGFLTNHYTIKCPWQAGPDGLPRGDEVEIKAIFLDYLSGRSFTANKVVKVNLDREGTSDPSANPASKDDPDAK